MGVLIGLAIVVSAVLLIRHFLRRKTGKLTTVPTSRESPAISLSISHTELDSVPDMGLPIPGKTPNSWIINPRGTFPLTIYPTTGQIAREIKGLLDQSFNWGGGVAQAHQIEPLMLREGLRCKEVDNYVALYKRKYLEAIENLKQMSSEWVKASDLDRRDLTEEFAKRALTTLDVNPGAICDLSTLFSDERDALSTRSLINRFGFESVQFYVRSAGRLDKVHIVPAKHPSRASFERLVELGLAVRGENVGVANILNTLTLKELQEVVQDDGGLPSFKRKAPAIEYALNLDDITERLSKKVALREFFQLRPLPRDFEKVSVGSVLGTIRYTHEVCMLISHTYVMSGYDFRDRITGGSPEFVTGWKILASESSCPACVKAGAVVYPKAKRPRVPLHIGCRCCVSPELKQ
jgi:hypothetical protein